MRSAAALFLLLAACGSGEEPAREQDPMRELAGPGRIPEAAPRKPPAAPKPRKGAKAIDFDTLSAFDYDPEADIIPDDVLALDGKLVELRGVMYYGVDDPDKVADFFLMPNHMICCYGTPRLNEAVKVTQPKGKLTQYVLNYYVIRGKLSVGAVRDDQGIVVWLYRLTNAEVEVLE